MHTFTKSLKKAFYLSLLLLGCLKANGQNFITEGFEGSFLPTGWTETSQGYYQWAQGGTGAGYAGGNTITPHGGSYMTWFNNWYANYYSANLITPAIPLQNYSGGNGRVSFWFYRMVNYGSDDVEVYANTTADLNGSPTLLGTVYVSESYSPSVSSPGWYKYSFDIPTSYNTGNVYIIFKDNSAYEYDSYMDDVSVDYIAPCASPTTAPAGLTFSTNPGSATINGTISPAASGSSTLVVRTSGTTPVGATPVNGTTYTVGSTFGAGTIVSVGPSTTFADAGVSANTQYTYTAFSLNDICNGGPDYYTTPLVVTTTSGSAFPLPLTETFNSGTMPAAWVIGPASSSLVWSYHGSGNGSNPGIAPHSSPGMMQFNSFNCCYTGTSYADLATPLLDFGGSVANPTTLRISFWMSTDNGYSGDADAIRTYVNSVANASGGTLVGTAVRYSSSAGSNGAWVNVVYTVTTTLSTGYIVFDGVSYYGSNIYMDDVNIYKLLPCTTPTTPPLGITFNTATPGVIVGTINPSTTSDATLVVRTTGTQPVNAVPVNGTNYTVGSTFGAGVVVFAGNNLPSPATFTDNNSVGSATQYTYTAFAYNSLCTGGPLYYTNAYTNTATSAFNPFTTVAVTGYNSDVIANGTGTPTQTTDFSITGCNGFDNAGYAFPAQDYHNGSTTPTTGYFPNGGVIHSGITSGLSWQLANYSGYNCLQLSATGAGGASGSNNYISTPVTTGTLTFVTPQRSPIIYLLISSGSGNTNYTATVNFTDGTSQTFTGLTCVDWFNGSPYAAGGVGRVNMSSGNVDGTPGSTPRLYQPTLTLSTANALKLISSITFANTQGGSAHSGTNNTLGVFAISIVSPCNGTPSPSTISSAAISSPICAGSTATINVTEATANSTVSGVTYVWQQAPTATGPWSPVIGGSGNGTLSYTTNGLATTTYFRMLDSCITTGQTMPTSNVYTVPVNSYAIPYFEPFTTMSNATLTNCFSSNNGSTSKWLEFDNFKSPDGTLVPKVVAANDPTNNAAGKNEYFTIPALALQGGVQYRIKFGYARGKDAPSTNTGTAYNENLNVYVSTPIAPGTAANQPPPNGLSIFNTTINFDNFAAANVLYTAPNTATYFFSWYSNTPHPQAGSGVPGGYVAIDSIKIDSVGCVAPTISFQPLSTVACIGNNATFSVSAIAYGIGYQWQVSTNGGSTWSNIADGPVPGATTATYAGSMASTLTIQAAASAMSTYKYRCYITGTCGGSAPPVTSSAATLTVSSFPTATITAGGPTAICPGTTVNLNANTGSGLTYQWKLNGVSLVNSSSATYAAGSSGGYTVTVTNSNGCSTTSTPTIISQNPAPPITISTSGPTTFCSGNSIVLTANTGVNITYQWLKDNANYGLPVNTLNVTTSGNYTLTETNTADGCTATYPVPINVIVNGPSTATATAAGATTFCLGGSVALNANTGTGYAYQWQVSTNGGAPVNINNAAGMQSTYSAAATGAYRVVITQNGCSLMSNYDTVTVNSPSTVVNQSSSSICGGNSVTLSAAVNANYTYQWYNGSTAISTGGTSSSYVTNTPGSYTVAIHDGSNGCNATSNPIVLNASTPPPSFITAAGPTTFCAGNSVLLYADTATGYTYQWKVDSGYGYINIPASLGGTAGSITTGTTANFEVVVSNGCSTLSSPVSVTAIPAPVPAITFNSTSGTTALCPGDVITLTTGTGTGLTYQWSNSSGNISGATTPSYTTGVGDTYTVLVTNNNNCTGTAHVAVTSNPYPVAHISASGSLKLCQGNSVLLTADAVTSGSTYKWLLNSNPVSSGPTYHVSSAGTYKLIVRSAAGCIASSQDTMVSILPLPVATVTPSGTVNVCSGNNVVLTANSGDGLTYEWTNSVGSTGITSSTYTANTPGSYAVIVTDTNNCQNISSSTTIMYNPMPVASIVSPATDTAVCQGNTATLTAGANNGYTYQWQRNGSNILGATNASYIANQSGTYTVMVYEGSCSASSAQRILTVNPLPASDTISYVGATVPSICAGAAAALTAPTGSGYSYQWFLNGGTITGANAASYGATAQGDYTVKVTTAQGCSEVTQPVTVNSYPDPNPTIIAYNLTLTTGTFNYYQWKYNNIDIPGANTNSIVATHNGPYSVFVTDANGCSKLSDTYNVTDVGVANVNTNYDVKIYPNPATSIVHIDAPIKVNVSISSIDGRELIHQKNAVEVNINDLANGTYMITITDEHNNVIKIDKLVKSGF